MMWREPGNVTVELLKDTPSLFAVFGGQVGQRRLTGFGALEILRETASQTEQLIQVHGGLPAPSIPQNERTVLNNR